MGQNRWVVGIVGALLASCSVEAPTLPGSPLKATTSAAGGALPATMTAAERIGKADGADPRDDYPEAYGYTEAPEGRVRLPGEFEPVSRMFVAWSWDAFSYGNFLLSIIKEGAEETRVTVLVPSQSIANAVTADLEAAEAKLENIEFVGVNIDSIWVRDYGPMAVSASSSAYIDARYYWGRWQDDYAPTALGAHFDVSVSRPALDFEGGNLLSDGGGRCVTTERLVYNNEYRGYTTADVSEILKDYYGCTSTVFLPPLADEGTGHVDMFVHLTGPRKALVGRYTADQDADNALLLDGAARQLERAGFTVTRIPMPKNDGRWVFRTYTNGLAVNDKVLVPVYSEDDEYQAEALRILGAAYPGRTIVPVYSDEIIPMSGAVHCVTMTESR